MESLSAVIHALMTLVDLVHIINIRIILVGLVDELLYVSVAVYQLNKTNGAALIVCGLSFSLNKVISLSGVSNCLAFLVYKCVVCLECIVPPKK